MFDAIFRPSRDALRKLRLVFHGFPNPYERIFMSSIFVLFWGLALFWLIAFLIAYAIDPVKLASLSSCTRDNDFYLHPAKYNYWGHSGFFQVTLGTFKNLNFEQAKVTDVMWDVIIGRGGQSLMALISWRVFAQYMTAAMEFSPVTYRSFLIVFIHTDSSIVSITQLIRDFIWRQGIRSRMAMTFIVLTMVYILAFPTLASALTGYTQGVQAYIQVENNSFIPQNQFQPVSYIIQDGNRANLLPNFPVIRDSDIHREVEAYMEKYKFANVENTSSYLSANVDPPILTIKRVEETFAWDNHAYNLSFIEKAGTCQNIENYKWGFSFVQLFLNAFFLLIWTIGLFILWLRAQRVLRKKGPDYLVGDYKAVIQLVSALQDGISDSQDLNELSQRELEKRIKDIKGGKISYRTPEVS